MADEHHKHEADHGGKHPRDRDRDFTRSPHASALLTELREHVPFSVSAVAIGLIVAGALTFCCRGDRQASLRTKQRKK